MQGQYVTIGGRATYFPPFVNERFDGPPYWACTFTSLLNGANVGWRGEKAATTNEIRALARASGDVDLRGGSRSSHMVKAVGVRYGARVSIERQTPEKVAARLGSGWAMVVAVTYGGLPKKYRHWSPRFRGGHRVVLIGWDSGRTRILDPMADRDHTYTGEWIQWAEFEPAWWSGEQMWFKEGMFVPSARYELLATLAPPRPWTVAAGSTLEFLDPGKPGVVARRATLATPGNATFDALVRFVPATPSAGTGATLIRVASGTFTGYLVDAHAPGVTADASIPAASVAAATPVAAGAGTAAARPQGLGTILEGRQMEWDRIRQVLPMEIALPRRP